MAKTSKAEEYRAGAARCELRAKKARNQDDREWQLRLARGYPSLIAYGFDSHRNLMHELGFEIVFRSHRHQHSLMKFARAAKKGVDPFP